MKNFSEKSELDVLTLRRTLGTGVHRLRWNEISVPVYYRRGTSDVMIVIFHGAVDRQTREVPRFQPHLPDLQSCHQISIGDPTLEVSSQIRSGWYIGAESMPLQAQLPKLLEKVFKSAGANKRIYLGGSSGGFAALYYSLLDPGSICIAVNPQTDLSLYPRKFTGDFLKAAWPSADSIADIGGHVVTDLAAAYARGFNNMVIYLQSNGDLRHYGTQLPGFFNAAIKRPDQFILNSSFWGIPGHSNSVPSKDYYPWVQAAVGARWLDRQAILDAYHVVAPRAARPAQLSSHSVKDINPQDLRLAELLRDHHLRQKLED